MTENTPNDAPAEKTQAQKDAAAKEAAKSGTVQPEAVSADQKPSEESVKQAARDLETRNADLNKAVTREANPNVAGESFAYLKNVGKA